MLLCNLKTDTDEQVEVDDLPPMADKRQNLSRHPCVGYAWPSSVVFAGLVLLGRSHCFSLTFSVVEAVVQSTTQFHRPSPCTAGRYFSSG